MKLIKLEGFIKEIYIDFLVEDRETGEQIDVSNVCLKCDIDLSDKDLSSYNINICEDFLTEDLSDMLDTRSCLFNENIYIKVQDIIYKYLSSNADEVVDHLISLGCIKEYERFIGVTSVEPSDYTKIHIMRAEFIQIEEVDVYAKGKAVVHEYLNTEHIEYEPCDCDYVCSCGNYSYDYYNKELLYTNTFELDSAILKNINIDNVNIEDKASLYAKIKDSYEEYICCKFENENIINDKTSHESEVVLHIDKFDVRSISVKRTVVNIETRRSIIKI